MRNGSQNAYKKQFIIFHYQFFNPSTYIKLRISKYNTPIYLKNCKTELKILFNTRNQIYQHKLIKSLAKVPNLKEQIYYSYYYKDYQNLFKVEKV